MKMAPSSKIKKVKVEQHVWDLWLKWYISYVISVFHTIAQKRWILKHQKHEISYRYILYITVQNTIVMYKYTCTLIYNSPVTQHTHIIYAQKFNMMSWIYVVDMTTYHMKQHKIWHSWFANRNIVYINIM